MEALKNWKKYIVENYSVLSAEVWQLGSDAKLEASNIYRDLTTNTTEIYNDIATSDYWKVTEGEKKPKNDDEITENPTGSESNNPKLDIFSVDTYPPKDSNPAIIVLKEDINARTEIDLETKS